MILITGANGFVGHKLMELCKDTAASSSLRNVTQEIVNRMIEESNADVVVHTAAISDIALARQIQKRRILQMCRFLCIWRMRVKIVIES